jgi:hypothetical protein
MFPFANQADIHQEGPRIVRERRHWDSEGYEQTQRRAGAVQCPKCHLWWPDIEDPGEWQRNAATGRRDATGWLNGICCEQCELLLVEQPDGSYAIYDLGER